MQGSTCIALSVLLSSVDWRLLNVLIKIQEHDSHIAASFIQVEMGSRQQIDDGILDINHPALAKLQDGWCQEMWTPGV